eukprot:COSAG02_NODE_3664_length_6402_cov_41.205775_1_plen_203_part_00
MHISQRARARALHHSSPQLPVTHVQPSAAVRGTQSHVAAADIASPYTVYPGASRDTGAATIFEHTHMKVVTSVWRENSMCTATINLVEKGVVCVFLRMPSVIISSTQVCWLQPQFSLGTPTICYNFNLAAPQLYLRARERDDNFHLHSSTTHFLRQKDPPCQHQTRRPFPIHLESGSQILRHQPLSHIGASPSETVVLGSIW